MTASPKSKPATASKALTPIDELRGTIAKLDDEFKKALPPQMPSEKFVRVVQTAIQMNPSLVECDRRSLLAACMKAAQDGLLLDGRDAALVRYNTKSGPMAQYMPMVLGLMKRVRNSGEVANWSAQVVKESDDFDYQLGDDEKIYHKPALADRGDSIGYYSIVTFKDGTKSHEFMELAEVQKIRARSKAKDNGPWVTDFDEMGKKTVIRRHSKKLPISTELVNLFATDDDLYEKGEEREAKPAKTRPARLAKAIDDHDSVETEPTQQPPIDIVEAEK